MTDDELLRFALVEGIAIELEITFPSMRIQPQERMRNFAGRILSLVEETYSLIPKTQENKNELAN